MMLLLFCGDINDDVRCTMILYIILYIYIL